MAFLVVPHDALFSMLYKNTTSMFRRIMKSLPKDESIVDEDSTPYEEEQPVVDALDLQTDPEFDAMRPVWPRNYT